MNAHVDTKVRPMHRFSFLSLFKSRLYSTIMLWFFACLLASSAVAQEVKPSTDTALDPDQVAGKLVVFNREIVVFRASFLGAPVSERVARAEENIDAELSRSKNFDVRSEKTSLGNLIKINGVQVFILTDKDVDQFNQETLSEITDKAVVALKRTIDETQEARNVDRITQAVLHTLAATVLMFFVLWLMRWLLQKINQRIVRLIELRSEQKGPTAILRERLTMMSSRVLRLLLWCGSILLVYEWLSFGFNQFPYTRPWGSGLNGFLFGIIGKVVHGMVSGVPGLLTALLILLLGRFVNELLGRLFRAIELGQVRVAWLPPDLAVTAQRLTKATVWLFTVAMAFPYLPGANTEAFKGMSVLVGLMVSLGASGLVGQIVSGLIISFTRVIRTGEYVHIADFEGTVVSLGMFSTRIRTGLGEELSIPNAFFLSNVSKNYSRTVIGRGYILDTVVTIGYGTPWRQVEGLLREAAYRTEGVLKEPAPRVIQTALTDFYPEYKLVCQAVPSKPIPRAEVMNSLHANIQDVFNEYGVQIMSPHYFNDPAEEKVVRKDNWYAAPAKPKSGKS